MLSGKMGVVEPVCENATEPFDCEIAEDPGRDTAVWLESRDVDSPLDKRRSQE